MDWDLLPVPLFTFWRLLPPLLVLGFELEDEPAPPRRVGEYCGGAGCLLDDPGGSEAVAILIFCFNFERLPS